MLFSTQLLISILGCRPEDTWSFSHLRTRLLCRSDGLATAVLRTGQASCWLSCSSVVSFEVCFHLPWLTFSVTGFHHDPTTREICFSCNLRITFWCVCQDVLWFYLTLLRWYMYLCLHTFLQLLQFAVPYWWLHYVVWGFCSSCAQWYYVILCMKVAMQMLSMIQDGAVYDYDRQLDCHRRFLVKLFCESGFYRSILILTHTTQQQNM